MSFLICTLPKAVTDSFLCNRFIIMTKGTTSAGRRHKRNHVVCKRCGNRSYHIQKHACGSCGFPEARIRHYNWACKSQRRRTTGTGRMRHLKIVQRRFKNGFREGGQASPTKNSNKKLREQKQNTTESKKE